MTCGYRKNQHVMSTESFGSKCKRDYCAKCGWLKINHNNQLMGPFCPRNPKHDSPHQLWHTNDAKVQQQRLVEIQEQRQTGII